MRVLTIKQTHTTRLTDHTTHQVYRLNGGGYDVVGGVLGYWLEDTQQHALQSTHDVSRLYGTCVECNGHVTLDGACGLTSMLAVANAVGLTITSFCDARGAILGFVVTTTTEEQRS